MLVSQFNRDIGHVTRKKRTKMALCYSTLAPLTEVGQCRHWMRMIIEERHWKTWCSWDWRDVGNYTISVSSVRQWHHYRVSAAICGHQPSGSWETACYAAITADKVLSLARCEQCYILFCARYLLLGLLTTDQVNEPINWACLSSQLRAQLASVNRLGGELWQCHVGGGWGCM